jgi:hypothetical protein
LRETCRESQRNVYQDARGAITVILVFLVITKGGSKGPPFSNVVEKK